MTEQSRIQISSHMIPTFKTEQTEKMKRENQTFTVLYYDLKSFTSDDLFSRNTELLRLSLTTIISA